MVLKKHLKWQNMLLCILIPLAVGAMAGWLIRDGMIYYKAMVMPLLSPPGWVFPVVWTLLYILMGIASCLVYPTLCLCVTILRTSYVLLLGVHHQRSCHYYNTKICLFLHPRIIFFHFFPYSMQYFAFLWIIYMTARQGQTACQLLYGYKLKETNI